jgi:head-tail adaptor
MHAGELVHRVSVRVMTEVSDGQDGFVDTPVVLHARMPAHVKPLSGRDLEHARQIDPRISHEVTLRYWRAYRADLAGGRTDLIYHDQPEIDREFEIVSPPVDENEAHVKLTLLCREVA